MLFTALLKVRGGSIINDRAPRRLQYSYPEGAKPVSEYWLQTTDPSLPHVVVTYEADGVAPIMAMLAAWDDHFHITVVPSVTAEEGLGLLEQMAQAAQQQA